MTSDCKTRITQAPDKSQEASTLANGVFKSWWSSEGAAEAQGAYTGRGQLLEAGAALFISQEMLAAAVPGADLAGSPALDAAREADENVPWWGGVSPSLDRGTCISQQNPSADEVCLTGFWLRGTCHHGTVRWLYIPCKRRGCPVCGVKRRRLIAWRIAEGIKSFGGAAWFVGTWDRDVSKAEAIKTQAKFIRWLRGYLGYVIEYAATWEVTKRGRLHLNLILAPWIYVPQRLLSAKWQRFGGGRVVWVKLVGKEVSGEVSKASVWEAANYFAKFEQMVSEGKGASYSEGWPKLPDVGCLERKGQVKWEYHDFFNPYILGRWREVRSCEFAFVAGEVCDCFEPRDKPG